MEEETKQSAIKAEQPSGEISEEAAVMTGTNEAQSKTKKERFTELFRNYFTATRISYLAVFTALAFILRLPWFEFYIIFKGRLFRRVRYDCRLCIGPRRRRCRERFERAYLRSVVHADGGGRRTCKHYNYAAVYPYSYDTVQKA